MRETLLALRVQERQKTNSKNCHLLDTVKIHYVVYNLEKPAIINLSFRLNYKVVDFSNQITHYILKISKLSQLAPLYG